MDRLKQLLGQIDGKGYKAYKQLQGKYQYSNFTLHIDHVQGDPFAEPSRCRIIVTSDVADIPAQLYSNSIRRIALEDFFGRSFDDCIKKHVLGQRGSGRSGEIRIAPYGQQVLVRNSVLIQDGNIEMRFQIALPADGRSINSNQAGKMLFNELPLVVESALLSINDQLENAERHVTTIEEQQHLREQLDKNNLVAFIGDGSLLPRNSGIDDRPLPDAVPTQAPGSMSASLKTLSGNTIRGLGIPRGVTLIVGGGFHGKSTLLHALEYGVYNHIPGDGRSLVVTEPSAYKVRAEDGRAITGTNISMFINNLPQGKDTVSFCSQNASGSTSQAANIMEALATESKTLLIDEDTSATNFMIRDQRMQALVSDDKEPITPLVQRVRQLYKERGVSVILVMGGSGDFFAHADQVLMLDNYELRDVTRQAMKLATEDNPGLSAETIQPGQNKRVPMHECLSPMVDRRREKIQAFATRSLRYGRNEIDTSKLEQLVDSGQLLAIGYLLRAYHENYSNDRDMTEILEKLLQEMATQGLDSVTPYVMGTLAMPRLQEVTATINRMRNLSLVK